MSDTSASMPDWTRGKRIILHGVGPFRFTVTYDVQKEAQRLENLIANRGRVSVDTTGRSK